VERFYEWWNTLHSEDRSRWDDEANAQNRIALVHEFQKNQEQDTFDRFSRQRIVLKNPDDQALIRWMSWHATNHNNELMALSPTDAQKGDAARPGRGGFGRGQQLMRAYVLWWSPQHPEIPTVTDTELRRLHETLSQEKQEELAAAMEKGLSGAKTLVRSWIQTACLDMLAEGKARLGTLGGRRGPDFQRGGGPRPFIDAPPPRDPPSSPDRPEAPRKD